MPKTLTEKTYLNLRKELISGDLKPGQRLVSRALAERLGVSLAPIREAIGRLAVEGFVEHVPGSGSFVKKISRQDLYELFVLREALESCAAAEAALNGHPVQFDEMDWLCQTFEELAGKIEGPNADQDIMNQWVDCEERFHTLLFDATKNLLLQKVAGNYRMQIQVFEVQRTRPMILTKSVADDTAKTHREIAQAIRERNSELARSRMLAHVQRGRQTIMNFFTTADS